MNLIYDINSLTPRIKNSLIISKLNNSLILRFNRECRYKGLILDLNDLL